MTWTETHRPHNEPGLDRYASDCTDIEWAVIEPCVPGTSRVGRPRKSNLREDWNAIQYIATTGCQWSFLPTAFHLSLPSSIISAGSVTAAPFTSSTKRFCVACRLCGRDEEPTATIIYSQSIKTTEAGGPRGFDAGKKIKGRKRHIVTDTQGHMLTSVVHEANIHDRDGALGAISLACASFLCIAKP